ncbi:MAG: hypothetical protein MI867_17340, partial [Pseudomonadales bacterium]|nr:hypothetical protein [Pseudomonadales bacterium]
MMDSEEEHVNGVIRMYRNKLRVYDTVANGPASIELGEYDMELEPALKHFKTIKLNKLNFTGNLSFRIENLTGDFNITGKRTADAYAMDPSKLTFQDGTVNKTAVGTKLYKCKDWNFTNQECTTGRWIKIMDLVPGQEYSFDISPVDPGFVETFDADEAQGIDLAALDNETLVIAFIDSGASNHASFEIWHTNGSLLVDEVDVDITGDTTSTIAVEPINTTHFVIAVNDGPENDLDFYIYDRTGTQVQGQTQIDPNIGTNTDVGIAQMGDRFIVCNANDADNDADFEVWSNDGTQIDPEANVDGNIGPALQHQNLVDCVAINTSGVVYIFFDE